MIESELKVLLDAEGEVRLRRHEALAARRLAPAQTRALVSTYYDTADHKLAAAGIALRLRRDDKIWVQTVKARREDAAAMGLFANLEIERPAPEGRLVLDGDGPEGIYARISELASGSELEAVCQTRVERLTERLAASDGAEIELAIDCGTIVAGERTAPIREAELELRSGDVDAIFEVARALLDRGPIRFATESKAARGYRLAIEGESVPLAGPRSKRDADYAADAAVDNVAREILRDCFAQIAANMVVVTDSEDPEGPHQLRVGLRRLRVALKLFRDVLDKAAAKSLSRRAKHLGRAIGRLRDLDVLIDETLAGSDGLEAEGAAEEALVAKLSQRREAAREEARAAISSPEAAGFVIDLARTVGSARQIRLTGQFIDVVAAKHLKKRSRKVRKKGKKLKKLDDAALHELRKELKKLRYSVEMFLPVWPGEAAQSYLVALKALQDTFGELNDSNVAEEMLTGRDAPARDDPDLQRAIGRELGALAAHGDEARNAMISNWKSFRKAEPFWT